MTLLAGRESVDMDERVVEFLAARDMQSPLPYRVLDLESEVGEIAREVTTSTGYGANPGDAAVASDEIGDALVRCLRLPTPPTEHESRAFDASTRSLADRIGRSFNIC